MATLMWLMLFALGLSWFCFAPMMLTMMDDLSITFEKAGVIIALVPLALVIVCIPSGLFADRFGFKRTVLIGGIAMSVFGLFRGFSRDFATLAITTFLCGVGYAITYPALPKVVGIWFHAKEYALATGIVFSGMVAGLSASFVLTPAVLLPLSGSWQGVFIAIGILSLTFTIVWIVLAREASESTIGSFGTKTSARSISFRKSLSAVAQNKHIWIAALIGFFLLGSQIGFIGFFPAILELQGIDPSTAGVTASMITWLMILGSLIMPNASDRVGLRRPFFWISSIIAGAALYFAGTMIGLTLWISIIVYGFLSGGMAALALAMPIELAGPSYAATAGGLSLVVGYLGAIIGPWLVGYLSTMTGSFFVSTIVCVILTEANVILGLILKETGKKAFRKNT